MYEFDPMKEPASESIRREEPDATGSRHTDGTEYTAPDGSHGLIYTPRAKRVRKRRVGKILAAVVITVAALSLVACFVLSAHMVATFLGYSWSFSDDQPSVGLDTSEFLHIFEADEEESDHILSPDNGRGEGASHGQVRGLPTLDFTVVDVTSVQTAVRYFNSMNTGVYVYDKSHETARYGDFVVAADGIKIDTVAKLSAVVASKNVGDTLELTVYRANSKTNKWEKQILSITVVEDVPQ